MSDKKNLAVEIKDLVVEFRTDDAIVQAVNGLDLEIEKGKTLGLVGETGAGKTTTGLSILRLIPDPPGKIVSGTIKLGGEDIFAKSEKEMEKVRGNQVSMIFQDPMTSLDPVMTVEDQIAEVVELHENVSHAKAVEKAKEMLELVGIPGERGTEYPHQFSGGMKQRVVIAIALACSPALLIADEPTTALDVTIQAQVLEMMKNLKEQYNTSMLMITHDLGVVANVADRVAVMYAGQIVEYGTVEEIFYDAWHPYTWALLQALPQLGTKGEALPSVDGTPPNLFNEIKGDAFAPRNKHALAIDFVQEPPFFQVSETHAAKTWYLDPRAPKIERPHSIQNLREKMGKMGGANLNG